MQGVALRAGQLVDVHAGGRAHVTVVADEHVKVLHTEGGKNSGRTDEPNRNTQKTGLGQIKTQISPLQYNHLPCSGCIYPKRPSAIQSRLSMGGL